MSDQAFVTLATTNGYCRGSLVVGKCLRKHGTTRKLVVMVSSNISREACKSLEDVFDEVIVVDVLDSRDSAHLSLLKRPELGVSFTKIHCWTLTHYSKCVFLDADTLVQHSIRNQGRRALVGEVIKNPMVTGRVSKILCADGRNYQKVLGNVDELFQREELSAAPDPGWPDCFNSGVFVFRPSLNTYLKLLEHADLHGSFDGGDQGLLNSFFSNWASKDLNKHLPFIYNLSASALYTYLPAFHNYGHQAKIIHFLGETKPWHFPNDQEPSSKVPLRDPNRNLEPYIKLWWKEYFSETHQNRQRSLAALQKTPQPQSQETGPEAQSSEKEAISQSLGDLSFNPPHSSSCHKPVEMMSSDLNDAEKSDISELQDPAFGQEDDDDMREESTESDTDLEDLQFSMNSIQILPSACEEQAAVLSEEEHRRRWEEGRADYLGQDAFENILRKLNQFLD